MDELYQPTTTSPLWSLKLAGRDMSKAKEVWKDVDAVILDVDATLIQELSLYELVRFCGKEQEVSQLIKTSLSKDFIDTLINCIEMIRPSKNTIKEFNESHTLNFSPRAKELVVYLQTKGVHIYLVSGSFKSLIVPLAKSLNIPEENIYSNTLKFSENGAYAGFHESSMTKTYGKAEIAHHLKKKHNYKNLINIGDGLTDLEAAISTDAFIGYGGNIERKIVKDQAMWFITDFGQLLSLDVYSKTQNTTKSSILKTPPSESPKNILDDQSISTIGTANDLGETPKLRNAPSDQSGSESRASKRSVSYELSPKTECIPKLPRLTQIKKYPKRKLEQIRNKALKSSEYTDGARRKPVKRSGNERSELKDTSSNEENNEKTETPVVDKPRSRRFEKPANKYKPEVEDQEDEYENYEERKSLKNKRTLGKPIKSRLKPSLDSENASFHSDDPKERRPKGGKKSSAKSKIARPTPEDDNGSKKNFSIRSNTSSYESKNKIRRSDLLEKQRKGKASKPDSRRKEIASYDDIEEDEDADETNSRRKKEEEELRRKEETLKAMEESLKSREERLKTKEVELDDELYFLRRRVSPAVQADSSGNAPLTLEVSKGKSKELEQRRSKEMEGRKSKEFEEIGSKDVEKRRSKESHHDAELGNRASLEHQTKKEETVDTKKSKHSLQTEETSELSNASREVEQSSETIGGIDGDAEKAQVSEKSLLSGEESIESCRRSLERCAEMHVAEEPVVVAPKARKSILDRFARNPARRVFSRKSVKVKNVSEEPKQEPSRSSKPPPNKIPLEFSSRKLNDPLSNDSEQGSSNYAKFKRDENVKSDGSSFRESYENMAGKIVVQKRSSSSSSGSRTQEKLRAPRREEVSGTARRNEQNLRKKEDVRGKTSKLSAKNEEIYKKYISSRTIRAKIQKRPQVATKPEDDNTSNKSSERGKDKRNDKSSFHTLYNNRNNMM